MRVDQIDSMLRAVEDALEKAEEAVEALQKVERQLIDAYRAETGRSARSATVRSLVDDSEAVEGRLVS